MARVSSQSQAFSSSTSRPSVIALHGFAATTAGMHRRRLTVGSAASGSGSVSGSGRNMRRDLAHCRLGQRLTMPPA
ncbi:hypothetical protein SLE2022_265230 [Rubroshorea leprosula]